MVKKLFKHEFLSYARVMGIVYLVLLTIAAAGRVIQIFENDGIPYKIISIFSGLTYGVSVLGAMAFSLVFAIVRFYKNLFTAEGYLSHTLPVTPTQHILVKAVTAVSVEVITILMILLSGCVFSAGELLVEIWKALIYILEKIYEEMGFHSVVIGGELTILFLLELFSGVLLYYTFISIGQLFKKNRILAAVGAYFVYYIITQIFTTILSVIFSLVATTSLFDDFFNRLDRLMELYPYLTVHTGLWLAILLPAAFVAVEFIVVRKIITNKLNLE